MNTENPHRPHYPALDGLRGVAILLVVIYHNFGFINKFFFFGWLGVDLFFVLSGFLITDILLRTVGSPHYLRNFYMRRVLRIFPLYYLSLIVLLLVLPLIPDLKSQFSYYSDNQVWLWTYFQNWLFIFKPSGSTEILHHFWSLAVEEQFYLLWPLVILLIRNPKYLLAIISLLLICTFGFRLWIWMHHLSDFSYYNLYTFSRIDGICIGIMVALLLRINPGFLKKYTSIIVLFFAALNFAIFFINRSHQFFFPYLALVGYTTFAMMFGLLVNQAITGETKLINSIFNIQILKFFGKISYGFYIIHWPVYLLLKPKLFPWLAMHVNNITNEFLTSVITTSIAVFISWLSAKYFENYFLNFKTRYK
jgi:peptidoglycan/LPS O-acetylase OafA/YrhL